MKKNVWHIIERTIIDMSIYECIHDSKHAFVPKANILYAWRKLTTEENEEIASLVNICCN